MHSGDFSSRLLFVKSGCLYVVSVPIGNPNDITLRALEILKVVDTIFCEDSRVTIPFLKTHSISTKAITLYSVEDPQKAYSWIVDGMQSGKEYALVSDAGTPGVNDPGSLLVQTLSEQHLKVVPIPGPSAMTTILSISGKKLNPSVFLGFLPEKNKKAKELLQKSIDLGGPIVVFVSVHRFSDFQNLIHEVLKETETEASFLLGREMTKPYEEYLNFSSLEAFMDAKFVQKGEFTVVFTPIRKKKPKVNRYKADISNEVE